jgi:hypothetical protein
VARDRTEDYPAACFTWPPGRVNWLRIGVTLWRADSKPLCVLNCTATRFAACTATAAPTIDSCDWLQNAFIGLAGSACKMPATGRVVRASPLANAILAGWALSGEAEVPSALILHEPR